RGRLGHRHEDEPGVRQEAEDADGPMSAGASLVPRAGDGIGRLEAAFGVLIDALAVVASLLLLAMVLIICGDVLTRNVAVPGLPRGLAWSNEIAELLLFLITVLAAPWLLRQGRHIRV